MLRAAVFDLDYTLFDPRTLPAGLFSEVESHVREVANGQVSAPVLDAALADAWCLPFDRVVAHYRLPQAVSTAWQRAAAAVEVVERLSPYPDVVAVLRELPLERFLLTTGFRRLQESKVRQLGLASLFVASYVDALDPPGPVGKRILLERLLAEHRLTASQVVVVGDRADDELSAARALGMVAVQILRPGVAPDPDVAWRLPNLRALPALLTRLSGPNVA